MTQTLVDFPLPIQDKRTDAGALLGVILLHGLILLGVLQLHAAPAVVEPPHPLIVNLIPPKPEALKPAPTPVKPKVSKPVTKPVPKTPPLRPILTARQTPNSPPETIAPAPVVVEPPPAPVPTPQPAPPAPVTPPRSDAAYLDNIKPPYPMMSRRAHEEGKVLLRVFVNIDGSVKKVELVKSSGFARLDQSALDTVPRWRFSPARQGDSAVAASVIVPIQFNLKD